MPDTREDTSEDGHSTDWRIVTLWRKIHFSGRVIMCSVLLGLGLILIGALIFVTNLDDDTVNKNKSNGDLDVPTKAPANYSGPVVMGIGSFIVTVGVIMCLFETQVCRRKTADSKPLISESADDAEKKVSDPESVPSTSQGQKIHRHGARKASSSPRKHKSRHAKSHSRERNQQKSPSPKSLPVSIETPRYLTSSGENFLTPPSTLDEHTSSEKEENPRNVDDKNASLMKSFTSSDPSWNQSAEFLTPSTSFRDASLSLNNSPEIDPRHVEVNNSTEMSEKQNKNSEYLTPLTVEEDRIQQLLIRVKNEQKQTSDTIPSAETPENLKSESNLSSSLIHEEIREDSDKVGKAEKESSTTHKLQSTAHYDSLISKEDKIENLDVEDIHKLDPNNCKNLIPETDDGSIINETINNTLNENIPVSEAKILPSNTIQQAGVFQNDPHSVSTKSADHDQRSTLDIDAPNSPEEIKESQNDFDSVSSVSEAKILPSNTIQQTGVFPNDPHSVLTKSADHDQRSTLDIDAPYSPEEIKESQNDFDSSVSSNETIVSPDSFQENPTEINITPEKGLSPKLKEELSNNETKSVALEFANNAATDQNNDYEDQTNTQENISSDKVEASDLKANVTETVETLNARDTENKVTENISKEEPS